MCTGADGKRENTVNTIAAYRHLARGYTHKDNSPTWVWAKKADLALVFYGVVAFFLNIAYRS